MGPRCRGRTEAAPAGRGPRAGRCACLRRACACRLTKSVPQASFRPMPDPAAPEWYALSQATMCLGAAWAILAMWGRGTPVRAGEPAPAVRRDRGLLWLGAGVAIWGVTGLVLLLPTATAMRPF